MLQLHITVDQVMWCVRSRVSRLLGHSQSLRETSNIAVRSPSNAHLPVAKLGEKRLVARPDQTFDLHFPWQITQQLEFPRNLKPLKVFGCGPFSKYVARAIISHYANLHSPDRFSMDKFSKIAGASVVAYADAATNVDLLAISQICSGEIGKLIDSYLSVTQSRGLEFQLHIEDISNLKVAGGCVFFIYGNKDERTLMDEGLEVSMFRRPIFSNHFVNFIHYVGTNKGTERFTRPVSALLRFYVSFTTREVCKVTEAGGNVIAGSPDVRKNTHVATFERVVCCKKPGDEAYFEADDWRITDMDNTLLKIQHTLRRERSKIPILKSTSNE